MRNLAQAKITRYTLYNAMQCVTMYVLTELESIEHCRFFSFLDSAKNNNSEI